MLVPSFFFGIALGIEFFFEMDKKVSLFAILLLSSVFFLHYETEQEAEQQPGTSQKLCSHHMQKVQALEGRVPFVHP